MKQVIKYKCDLCGELFDFENDCRAHEDRHERIYRANDMLRNGRTLKEIQDECNIWHEVPKKLENVNTDNCFVVRHWQCCDKPAYKIDTINMDGSVRLWGCGSWSGYYGHDIYLYSNLLLNPHPAEELFIDKRYAEMYGY